MEEKMEYYLFATNDCNLQCKYCSILLKADELKIPKEPVYSIDDLNQFINTTQKQYHDHIADIIFFGGEPTLNYSFIQKVINVQSTLGELPYQFRYMLHTNGLLLGEVPDEVLNALHSIMVSINYDKIPHSGLNDSYFHVIENAVHSIKKRKKIPVVGRFTITEDTSLYSEVVLFNAFFDAIYWQIENKYDFTNFSSFYSSYKYELELVFELWLNYLSKGILVRLIPFMAAAHFSKIMQTTDAFCCGYNNSMVYIQTNGLCYTCAEDMTTEKNLIGNIHSYLKFDYFSIKDTKCTSCKYLYMCMGRCGRMHKEFSDKHVNEYCSLNQILFDLIIDHYKKIQNYCDHYNISLDLANPIYHYTEYTP